MATGRPGGSFRERECAALPGGYGAWNCPKNRCKRAAPSYPKDLSPAVVAASSEDWSMRKRLRTENTAKIFDRDGDNAAKCSPTGSVGLFGIPEQIN